MYRLDYRRLLVRFSGKINTGCQNKQAGRRSHLLLRPEPGIVTDSDYISKQRDQQESGTYDYDNRCRVYFIQHGQIPHFCGYPQSIGQ